MWTVEQYQGRYILQKKGHLWASILAGTLLAIWMVMALGVAVSGTPGLVVPLVFWSVFLIVPAWLLSRYVGQTQRRSIAAITASQEVVGGAVLSLIDSKNQRHDVVTTAETARAVVSSL